MKLIRKCGVYPVDNTELAGCDRGMDTHVCHNHDGSEHLHHQFPIIDRFILEWLTDADLARTRICMSEDVEEEFLTAMDTIRYEEVRELMILSALHNNVHDLVEIEA